MNKAAPDDRVRRGFPFLPTLMTLLALPILVALGVWQLQRADQKESLLQALATAPAKPPVDLNQPPHDSVDFRRGSFVCDAGALPVEWSGGEGADGRPGFVARVTCPAAGPSPAVIVSVGFSDRPIDMGNIILEGPIAGQVRDLGPGASPRYRLIAERPLAPLGPMKPARADDIPNNHLAYAAQWFAFAATLLVIYILFLRRQRRVP